MRELSSDREKTAVRLQSRADVSGGSLPAKSRLARQDSQAAPAPERLAREARDRGMACLQQKKEEIDNKKRTSQAVGSQFDHHTSTHTQPSRDRQTDTEEESNFVVN